MNEVELVCAVAQQALKDLTAAYKKKDPVGIREGEWFFLSGNSLFDTLDIDGSILVDEAKKRARE